MLGNTQVVTTIASADLERAGRFYSEALGLSMNMDQEGALFFDAGGGSRLLVYMRPGHTPPENTVATFVVGDIQTLVAGLAGRGVVFEQYDFPGLQTDAQGIAEIEGSSSAWFKDPDGNILAISQLS